MKLKCQKHGRTEHAPRSRGGWRCRKCTVESVSNRRRKMKSMLVSEAGGKCIRCGYSKCLAALQFHHKDPSKKEFRLGANITKGIDRMRKEAKKCQLLCANCHAEVHANE